jgi:hypothetical protein
MATIALTCAMAAIKDANKGEYTCMLPDSHGYLMLRMYHYRHWSYHKQKHSVKKRTLTFVSLAWSPRATLQTYVVERLRGKNRQLHFELNELKAEMFF